MRTVACLALAATVHAQGKLYEMPGTHAAAAGDVDGDGRVDFLLGRPSDSAPPGSLDVRSGASAALLFSYVPPPPVWKIGEFVGAVGDVDGDGFGDVATVEREPSGNYAAVVSGASGTRLYRVVLPSIAWGYGPCFEGLGDVDGDGNDDFAIGMPRTLAGTTQAGLVRICSGSSGAALLTLTAPGGQLGFGQSLDRHVDLDFDGVRDLVVGAPYAPGFASGDVYVVSPVTGVVLFADTGWQEGFGFSVASIGDADGDGTADLAVGDPVFDTYPGTPYDPVTSGRVCVVSGADGSRLDEWRSYGPIALGHRVAAIGDYDGDGLADVLFSGGWYSVGSTHFFALGNVIRSPATGAVLYVGDADFSASLDVVGDVDGNGSQDYLVGERAFGSAGSASVVLTQRAAPYSPYECTYAWPYSANGNQNSLGCFSDLRYQGAPSLTIGDDFGLTTTSVRNQKNGLLLWSMSPLATTFAGQNLCVGAPLQRLAMQSSGGSATGNNCTGSLSFPLPKATMAALGWTAGAWIAAQSWTRDPGYAAHMDGHLSTALHFVVWP
jgi:hypothetical protein